MAFTRADVGGELSRARLRLSRGCDLCGIASGVLVAAAGLWWLAAPSPGAPVLAGFALSVALLVAVLPRSRAARRLERVWVRRRLLRGEWRRLPVWALTPTTGELFGRERRTVAARVGALPPDRREVWSVLVGEFDGTVGELLDVVESV